MPRAFIRSQKYPCSPLDNLMNIFQWLSNDRFILIYGTHKKFQESISAINRNIYLKQVKETYMYLTEFSPLFGCLNNTALSLFFRTLIV